MTDTVESLATELSRAFERRKREYGQHEPGLDHYTALREGSPQWMKDACRAAHDAGGDLMLPDDWRYEFIEDAADALAEHEGDEDRARDYLNESDHYCYTHQQTGWLHSHVSRQGYVDEAVESGLTDGSEVTRAIRVGMLLEQEEVLAALYRFLDNLADERDEDQPCNEIVCSLDAPEYPSREGRFVCEAERGTEHTHAEPMDYFRPLRDEEEIIKIDECVYLDDGTRSEEGADFGTCEACGAVFESQEGADEHPDQDTCADEHTDL